MEMPLLRSPTWPPKSALSHLTCSALSAVACLSITCSIAFWLPLTLSSLPVLYYAHHSDSYRNTIRSGARREFHKAGSGENRQRRFGRLSIHFFIRFIGCPNAKEF